MLENNLKDLLNAGIGLVKLGEENIQKIISDFQKNFSELKEKGARDNSEMAVRLRDILGRTLNDVKSVSDQAEKNLNRFLDEAKLNSGKVLQNFRSFIGEDKIKDFSSKMEEISKNIQKRPRNGFDTVIQKQDASETDHPSI